MSECVRVRLCVCSDALGAQTQGYVYFSLELLDGSFDESTCHALRGLKALTSLHVWGRTEIGQIMVCGC